MRLAVGLPSLDVDCPQRQALDDTFAAVAARGHDVEGFAEHDRTDARGAFPVFHYLRLAERHAAARFDAAIYPIGRDASPYQGIYTALRRQPSVVWLLDPVLHHLALGGVALMGDWASYRELLDEAYGRRGAAVAQTMASNWGTGAVFRRYSLIAALTRGQHRVLAASPALARRASAELGFEPQLAPLAFTPAAVADGGAELRKVAIMSVNESYATSAVKAAAALLDADRRLEVQLCLSEPVYEAQALRVATHYGIAGRIDWQLAKSPSKLLEIVADNDVLIWLAEELHGLHRLLLQQGLAAGKVTIVPRTDLYDDLPAGAVARVDLGRATAAGCRALVEKLGDDIGLRSALSRHARDYGAGLAGPAAAADLLIEALRAESTAPSATPISRTAWARLDERLLSAALPDGASGVVEARLRALIRARTDELRS